MRIHKIDELAYITKAMNVKHHPRPMELIIWIITPVMPAPKMQRHRLLPAVTVAGEAGSMR